LTSKKHLKAAAKLVDSSTTPSKQSNGHPTPSTSETSLRHLRKQKNRALALKESLILSLIGPEGPLSQILADTLANTERRAALTERERATEIEEMEAREAAEAAAAAAAQAAKGGVEEEEDDGRIYNPLRLPLGWDGKPIPFWLYKLHGLGVEYKCEICSDYVRHEEFCEGFLTI
jgi:splicing factor 3A subunit 3